MKVTSNQPQSGQLRKLFICLSFIVTFKMITLYITFSFANEKKHEIFMHVLFHYQSPKYLDLSYILWAIKNIYYDGREQPCTYLFFAVEMNSNNTTIQNINLLQWYCIEIPYRIICYTSFYKECHTTTSSYSQALSSRDILHFFSIQLQAVSIRL